MDNPNNINNQNNNSDVVQTPPQTTPLQHTITPAKEKKKSKKKEKRKEKRVQSAVARKEEQLGVGGGGAIVDPTEEAKRDLELQLIIAQEQIKNQQENAKWEEREREAQRLWEEHQLELVRLEKERQEELERKRIEREEKRKLAKEAQLKREAAAAAAPPDETFGTEKDNYNCSFFLKTGVCRYGESCGKRHPYPGYASTLVFKNMYDGLGLAEVLDEEADEDLQHEESEIRRHFEDFYYDILPEFRRFGEIQVLQICRNYAQHLRGNVYVQFKDVEAAVACMNALSGRYYATKQLKPLFVPITKWKSAICGLYDRNRCPKGKECNFLHVYHNPRGEYEEDIGGRMNRPPLPDRRDRDTENDKFRGRRERSPLRERERDRSRDHYDRERPRDYSERDKERGRDRGDRVSDRGGERGERGGDRGEREHRRESRDRERYARKEDRDHSERRFSRGEREIKQEHREPYPDEIRSSYRPEFRERSSFHEDQHRQNFRDPRMPPAEAFQDPRSQSFPPQHSVPNDDPARKRQRMQPYEQNNSFQ